MKFNIFPKRQPKNQEIKKEMKDKIVEEYIRQAQLTFNLALGVTTASAIMTLLGVGLLYVDKMPEASLTAGTGIIASIGSVQFAKDAREELQEILEKAGTAK
ncbi:hypothetical protein VB713_06710 [Anabaena cylindrica UHCC 0172]|uniref:TRADD-N-associated membrane domain-containing protein n=1 Tax=Anabaena cylindrica TaxID=1165 RepID=UPI002B21288C|nr:hypothetical protein [Anabaena cylindrica]MEA5550669.1 hypothetical protein [Anabaena cylindrica UHCC 0172]